MKPGSLRAVSPLGFGLAVFCMHFSAASCTFAQRLVLQARETKSGKVVSVGTGVLDIQTSDGKTLTCRIQELDEQTVALTKGVIRFPASVTIRGKLPQKALAAGMFVQGQITVNKLGRTSGKMESLKVSEIAQDAGLTLKEEAKARGYSVCEVSGRVESIRRGRMTLRVPPNEIVPKGRITAELKKDAEIDFESNQYRKLKPGDTVTKMVVARFNTGDHVIQELHAKLAGENSGLATQEGDAKYAQYSDTPVAKPRNVRSAHFILLTDISDRKAKRLLDRLEYMVGLVSKYYSAPPKGVIKCVVAKNVNAFREFQFPPQAFTKMSSRAGVTISQSLGGQRTSTVYSCDDFGVVQHEAVHAYCNQTFGSPGPTWYAEGMAEMGNYWKDGQLAVDISPIVITYLKRAPLKELLQIVAPGQRTGDSWQAYAWRWALCHMLAHNPNYSGQFKSLGLGMMTGKEGFSFESAYGAVAREVSFEYDFFVKHLDNGFRADLCAWDWKGTKKSKKISTTERVQREIAANRGWQPTGVHCQAGISYDIAAVGEWNTAKGQKCEADGHSDGRGKLVGVMVIDGKLGKPFPIGKRGTIEAEADGILFVRCRDSWTKLADNSGTIKVHVRRTPK